MGKAITGGKVRVGLYDETVYKTAGASGVLLPYAQFSPSNQQGREESAILAGYYGQARGILGNKGVSGSLTSELAPEDIGIYLKHLIGTPTTTAAGTAFKHTFEVGEGAKDIPAGFTLEQDFGTALASATHRVLRYIGCRFGKGTLNFNASSGIIGTSFDVMGADVQPFAAPLDASLDDLGHSGWSVANLGMVLSNGATIESCFRSVSLDLLNTLDPDFFCLQGGGVRDDLPRQQAGAGGTAVGLFDSDALLKQTMSDTDASLVTTLTRGDGLGTAGNEKLVITIPALTFAPASVPVEGPRGLLVNTSFTAHRTTGEIGIKAELWNAQATI